MVFLVADKSPKSKPSKTQPNSKLSFVDLKKH
jgi:hypothetical protein